MNVPIDRKLRNHVEYNKKRVYKKSNRVSPTFKHSLTSSSPFVLNIGTKMDSSPNAFSINANLKNRHSEIVESPKKRSRKSKSPQIQTSSSSSIQNVKEEEVEDISQPNKKQKRSKRLIEIATQKLTPSKEEKPTIKPNRKLRLNDAMSILEETKNTKKKKSSKKNNKDNNNIIENEEERLSHAGWSEARINAYKNKDKNPNAYYYRFNDPNEAQRTGEWDCNETTIFYNNIINMGVNNNWGLFSKNIKGRVGYQCSNYYRKLILNDDIYDSCYTITGKSLKFSFNNNNPFNYVILKPAQNDIKNLLNKICGSKVVVIIPNLIDPDTDKSVVNPHVDREGNCMSINSWKKVKNVYYILIIYVLII